MRWMYLPNRERAIVANGERPSRYARSQNKRYEGTKNLHPERLGLVHSEPKKRRVSSCLGRHTLVIGRLYTQKPLGFGAK